MLLDRVFDTFTKEGRGGRMRHWLWNDLRKPCFFSAGPHDLDTLLTLGNPSFQVWLVVEDFCGTKRNAPYWIFEATLGAALETLQNHHLLEFHVVSRDFTWLVGENHHGVWFAAGDHAVATLQALTRRDVP